MLLHPALGVIKNLIHAGIMEDRKWVTEEDDYICRLSEETQCIAKHELREDDHSRRTALESMREWIKQNPRIKNCRMGMT